MSSDPATRSWSPSALIATLPSTSISSEMWAVGLSASAAWRRSVNSSGSKGFPVSVGVEEEDSEEVSDPSDAEVGSSPSEEDEDVDVVDEGGAPPPSPPAPVVPAASDCGAVGPGPAPSPEHAAR